MNWGSSERLLSAPWLEAFILSGTHYRIFQSVLEDDVVTNSVYLGISQWCVIGAQ